MIGAILLIAFKTFLLAIPATLLIYPVARMLSRLELEDYWKHLLGFLLLYAAILLLLAYLYATGPYSCFQRVQGTEYYCDMSAVLSKSFSTAMLPALLISLVLYMLGLTGWWIASKVSVNNRVVRYFIAVWLATFMVVLWVVFFPWWLASLWYYIP